MIIYRTKLIIYLFLNSFILWFIIAKNENSATKLIIFNGYFVRFLIKSIEIFIRYFHFAKFKFIKKDFIFRLGAKNFNFFRIHFFNCSFKVLFPDFQLYFLIK